MVSKQGYLFGYLSLKEGYPQKYSCRLRVFRNAEEAGAFDERRIDAAFMCFDEKSFWKISKLASLKCDGLTELSLTIEPTLNNELLLLEPKYKSGEIALKFDEDSNEASFVLYDEHLYNWLFTLKKIEKGYRLMAKLQKGVAGL